MMSDQTTADPTDTLSQDTQPVQLVQVRIPLEDAADAFAGTHPPLVVLPKYAQRIRNDFLAASGIALLAGVVAGLAFNGLLFAAGVALALVLLAFAMMRALFVRVPEGTVALLNRGGKYVGELTAGVHALAPWSVVTYLVTTREIPYDAPVFEAPTSDNVRATVDILLTFSVVDARRFVYGISASDFDRVLAAAAQDAVRLLVRGMTAEHVTDLAQRESEDLQNTLSGIVEPYGVKIRRVVITAARPSEEFLRSLEARQLAAVQRSEEAERHALAQQRQADAEALARQEIVARLEREREEQQQQVLEAETRRRVAEADVETHALRLSKLEAALRANPLAAQWETQTAQLEVARALAGNTRAVVQLGAMDEITRALMTRDIYQATDQSRGASADQLPPPGPAQQRMPPST
jgi:regulator of protease activity HflC (stomatin/prohibitin superfamily)